MRCPHLPIFPDRLGIEHCGDAVSDPPVELYLLIFLLSLFSAAFKPIYAATIPEILSTERQYTRALSMARQRFSESASHPR